MRPATPILIVISLASCSTASENSGFSEVRLLATIPDGIVVRVPPAFAKDGSTVAYVAESGDQARIVRDRWRSRPLDAV